MQTSGSQTVYFCEPIDLYADCTGESDMQKELLRDADVLVMTLI